MTAHLSTSSNTEQLSIQIQSLHHSFKKHHIYHIWQKTQRICKNYRSGCNELITLEDSPLMKCRHTNNYLHILIQSLWQRPTFSHVLHDPLQQMGHLGPTE